MCCNALKKKASSRGSTGFSVGSIGLGGCMVSSIGGG
jgi:hypothetical protein